jgi:hypothetical protein
MTKTSGRSNYVIVYFKRGAHVSSSPWTGALEAAKRVARDGLVRRGADECQIRSDTLDGPLVWHGGRSSESSAFGVGDTLQDS